MTTLEQAALRLAAIVESSDDAIVSHDLHGTIQTWNRAASKIFGYGVDEIIGQPVHLLFPPERRTDERQLMQRIRDGEPLARIETTAVTRDRRHLPVSMLTSPVRTASGEIIGAARVIHDLSRQRRAEHDASHLAALVNSSEDAIISKDLEGRVQTWNSSAERMFGFSAAEMIGQPIQTIIPADRYAEEERVLSRIRAGLPVEHFETVRKRKDGSLIDISLSVSPIRTLDGTVIGASKIARDITAQRRLARQAEEANRTKDEFLATLSHELRTPLNAVLGYTRMLRSGTLALERQERAFDVIERNATLLHQLVSDVLDVSGIVTGRMRVHLAAADLGAIIGAACDSVRPTSETKGVRMHVEKSANPIVIRCDADRMQQVFWNLFANAVKFTPRGGEVTVTTAVGDHTVTVVITDTGVGITPEALHHVFERFWQGDNVNSRQTGGLGLGLSLARHFVELHGGTISAASPGVGKGATFTVTLPLDERSNPKNSR